MSIVSRRFSRLFASVAVCALALSASTAHADGKILGPTACKPYGINPSVDLTYGFSHVTNNTGAQVSIVCALVRDTSTNTNGLQDLEVSITDPTGGSMVCNAFSVGRNGATLSQLRKNAGTSTAPQIIDFGSALNASASRGHYAVVCEVPNGGKIHSIFYEEY